MIINLNTYGGAQMIAGYAGQIVNSNDATTIVSCNNEAATAIDFGVAVTRGVATGAGATENVKVLNTNGQVPYGISVRAASSLIARTAFICRRRLDIGNAIESASRRFHGHNKQRTSNGKCGIA